MSFDNYILKEELKKRMSRAAITLANRAKELLSVPAPRTITRVKPVFKPGEFNNIMAKAKKYYRATVPATPGAYPRKLSGHLRRSVSWEIDGFNLIARVGTNVTYGRTLEYRNHPWLQRTLDAIRPELEKIIAGQT